MTYLYPTLDQNSFVVVYEIVFNIGINGEINGLISEKHLDEDGSCNTYRHVFVDKKGKLLII